MNFNHAIMSVLMVINLSLVVSPTLVKNVASRDLKCETLLLDVVCLLTRWGATPYGARRRSL